MGYQVISKLARLADDGRVTYGASDGYRIGQWFETFAEAQKALREVVAQYPKSIHTLVPASF